MSNYKGCHIMVIYMHDIACNNTQNLLSLLSMQDYVDSVSRSHCTSNIILICKVSNHMDGHTWEYVYMHIMCVCNVLYPSASIHHMYIIDMYKLYHQDTSQPLQCQ